MKLLLSLYLPFLSGQVPFVEEEEDDEERSGEVDSCTTPERNLQTTNQIQLALSAFRLTLVL